MKDIRIFIASSRELVAERNALSCIVLSHEDEFAACGFRVRLSKWEYVSPHVTREPTESRYLADMRNCDATVVLFKNVIRPYTRQEMDETIRSEQADDSRLKAHRILFCEGADAAPEPELVAFRQSLSPDAYGTFSDRAGLEEEFLALVDRLAKEPDRLKDLPPAKGVRVVTALFAADDELAADRDAFADLVLHLESELRCHGVRLKLDFYDPKRHDQLLDASETALVLYRAKIGAFGRRQMDDAYARATTQGRNPGRLYVFFRDEEGRPLDADFVAFRDGFEKQWGHFVSRIETAEQMHLNFVLSLTGLLGGAADKSLAHLDGYSLKVGERDVGDFRFLSVVANNAGLVELENRLAAASEKCTESWALCRRSPTDVRLAERLVEQRVERERLQKQIEGELQRSLMLARRLSSFAVCEVNEAVLCARERAEQGDLESAQRILDEASASQVPQFSRMLERWRGYAATQFQDVAVIRSKVVVDEFRAEVILSRTDTPFVERLDVAGRIYNELISCLDEFVPFVTGKCRDELEFMLADVLRNLAYLYQDNGRECLAGALDVRALQIYRRLSTANPGKYDPFVAMLLHNLAFLHANANRLVEAERGYEEALAIYRQLADADLERYGASVAMALINLANVRFATNRFDEVERAYAEVQAIYRRLGDLAPGVYEYYLSAALHNLAVLHSDTNHLVEAEREFGEALQVCRRLADGNPGKYEPDVAMVLDNLATLHVTVNRHAKAEGEYGEALKICRRLTDENSGKYEHALARTCNNLAIMQADMNRFAEAERGYDESLAIYRRLARMNPAVFEPEVARVLNNRGLLFSDGQRLAEAEEDYAESLKIRRLYAEGDSEKYKSDEMQTLRNLADLHAATNRQTDAEREYGEVLALYRGLAKMSPEKYEAEVAATLNCLGVLHADMNRYGEAEHEYDQALAICRGLMDVCAEKYEADMAKVLNNLAALHAETSHDDMAAQEFEKAVKIYRRLTNLCPDKYGSYAEGVQNNFVKLRLGVVCDDERNQNHDLVGQKMSFVVWRR